MAMTDGDRLDVILCVPQKSQHVPNRYAYLSHCDEILEECQRLATAGLPDRKASFRLNARDIIERDELYLTYTGSSIESGDEGLVGRGNRVNGMITPLRPMNLEGVSGKNPVYHVGKLYNVAANRIAGLLHQRFGGYAEVHLISATGQALDRPWQMVVRMASTDANRHEVQDLANSVLSDFPGLTTEIIYGDLRLA